VYSGTFTTSTLRSITSVGTLTNLVATGTISASVISASTFTGGTYSGTFTTSTLRSITSVGTLTDLSIESPGDADDTLLTFTVTNRSLILTGIDNITIGTGDTVSALYKGGTFVGSNVQVVYLNTVDGIHSGATFKTSPSSKNIHTVLDVSTTTYIGAPGPASIQVSNTHPSEFDSVPVNTTFVFSSGVLLGKTYWSDYAPTTTKGERGDKEGTIYATSTTLYTCYTDYSDGSSDIWNIANINSILTTGTTAYANIVTLQTTVTNNFNTLQSQISTSTTFTLVPPATALGTTGHKKGMIYATTNSMFICFADYNGTSTIWTKVASTSTW
jgi:hypothetical protein